MNKRILIFFMISALLLSACGSKSSWDEEEVTVKSNRILSDDVKVAWTIENGTTPGAGGAKTIRLEIGKKDGERIEAFDVNHEKLLHLIVVSKDLSYFNHIHPEYKGNGVFEIDNAFPAGGQYRLIADFKPTGGDAVTKLEWMRIQGDSQEPVPVVPDSSLDKAVDGKRVKLELGSKLAAGKEIALTFSISDEKTGEPITDLEPYLGAIGHVVVLSEDGQRYVHVHAEEGQGTGPAARFEATFPRSGIYKIWGQFQKNQRVFTVPFVVKVE